MARPKTSADIESILKERRIFKPSPSFGRQAYIKNRREYDQLANKASKDPERFWASIAKELHWFKPWKKVLDWKPPFAKWFVGGKINISYNCLDRHLMTWRKNKAALIWEGEPGENRILTYQELHREVCKFANVLKSIGIIPGDRVVIYMPMIPELPIAMLACARIGATHSVIFGGFSAEALSGRINDCGAKVLITADGGWRRGNRVNLKHHADDAVTSTPTIEKVIVVDRLGQGAHMVPRRGAWWRGIL